VTYYNQSIEKDEKIKNETGYTPRVIPFKEIENSMEKRCFLDNDIKENIEMVIFAKAY
jgi:hypothetical protein